jgi:uncharacterized protein YbbK (DUF523 family)
MMDPNRVVFISACLLGINCRYDGTAKATPECLRILEGCQLVPFCPETFGGLNAPRSPAEIRGGDGAAVLAGTASVGNREGQEYTREFIRGAETVLALAFEVKPDLVVLKAKSPSCGVGWIYDGSFSGILREGDGVTTAMLRRNGFEVCTEMELPAKWDHILGKDCS